MRAFERLLKYVVVRTPSDETSNTVPSSSCQFDLAHILLDELKELGVDNAYMDDKGFVYGMIPATPGHESCIKLGFMSHMDTVSDYCDHAPTPVVTENYDGKDFVLGTSGRTLTVDKFPHLPSLKGRTLITSDGTTILGADDKAGIAEIMTVVEILMKGDIPHGQVSIAFTPDEEIGTGSHSFNVADFGAEYAYTVDGGPEGEIEYENFNACSAKFEIEGFSVHPGSSKDTMINASLIAMEINGMLPSADTPRDTEGYEGFFHLTNMSGDVTHATLNYIVRDHSAAMFAGRKETLRHIEKIINHKWGEDTVKLTIKDQYENMAVIIKDCMHLINKAQIAAERCGLVPKIIPIRGGTDGSYLSFQGLPCPNLGTGGYAFHGPYEHITAEGMDSATEMILEIIKIYANYC